MVLFFLRVEEVPGSILLKVEIPGFPLQQRPPMAQALFGRMNDEVIRLL